MATDEEAAPNTDSNAENNPLDEIFELKEYINQMFKDEEEEDEGP